MPEPAPFTHPDPLRSAAPKRPTICLVLHMYQPPNIPDSEIEQTVRCVYQPLLRAHVASGTPLTLNIQGCLLQRLRTIAPNFLEQLREVGRSRLLEFTSSAHYHPCLPLLPRARRKRQIALNLRTVQEILDIQPSGFWPPELAWSPALPEQLVEFGVHWTIIDGSTFLRAWSVEQASVDEAAAIYSAAELMHPYALRSTPGLIAVPRQHEWSRKLFEGDTLLYSDKLDALLEAMRLQARGLICLATDAERIAPDALRLYEYSLRALSEFSELDTISMAIESHPSKQTIDLPVWTWRGALDQWVRGEGERSFMRELDDAYLRRTTLMWRLEVMNLAAAVDDSLMKAESSCWLFWRAPYRFLAEGFAHIERANQMMDSI